MAKGQGSKDKVAAALAETFKEGWVGKHDNKYYINFIENGEKVQISIALTAVKNPIEAITNIAITSKPLNFEDDTPPWEEPVAIAKNTPAELTQEEKDNVAMLLKRVGL